MSPVSRLRTVPGTLVTEHTRFFAWLGTRLIVPAAPVSLRTRRRCLPETISPASAQPWTQCPAMVLGQAGGEQGALRTRTSAAATLLCLGIICITMHSCAAPATVLALASNCLGGACKKAAVPARVPGRNTATIKLKEARKKLADAQSTEVTWKYPFSKVSESNPGMFFKAEQYLIVKAKVKKM